LRRVVDVQPKFTPPQNGYPATLLCPECGFDHLHHDGVEVFERKEDQEQGLHVTVQDGKATIDQSLTGNPSSRRHGLLVKFWCEGCSIRLVLSVVQHKGQTHVEFKPV
jgi:hypothetical protein